jgi:nucleoside-diphosphate-sugar epimerase
MRVLIVGCGYVGVPLGAALVAAGHTVVGLRRTDRAADSLRAAGIEPVTADVTDLGSLRQVAGPFDWVVNTVAAGAGGGVDSYRQVYEEGTRNLLEWLDANPPKRLVYTSSTGVYGQDDGSVIKESSPTEPVAPTARVLVETERLWFEAAQQRNFPVVILRVAGIYGPDRGHWFKQYLANEAKIPGTGQRILNMIHRDDLVRIIIAALQSGRVGEVYNAVDDEPVTMIHFFRFLSETLGKNMPPFVAEEEDQPRKRGVTNKRVSNRKLKMELGCPYLYPTYRQGYTAEIRRLSEAGQLDFDPEPR